MNDVMQPFLHKFELVFFEDISVFSRSWLEHLQHVKLIFQTLRENKLALKQAKCSFSAEKVVYLGHIISTAEVAMDPSKVEAVEAWLLPRTLGHCVASWDLWVTTACSLQVTAW
jgi:hypothetical protein